MGNWAHLWDSIDEYVRACGGAPANGDDEQRLLRHQVESNLASIVAPSDRTAGRGNWRGDKSEEFKRCIVDERATNELIHSKREWNIGLSLCGKRHMLVQKWPKGAPVWLDDGRFNPEVELYYGSAWRLDHWFNHYRSYGGEPMYGICARCAAVVATVFADPSGHYVREPGEEEE